jgi:hypothetical protein
MQPAPLDAAFLSRTHVTTLWLGALLTWCAYVLTQNYLVTLSFATGAVLGALLLKSQEMFVRRLIRPKDAPPYSGWDALIPLWALLPLKYTFIIAGIALLFRYQMIHPVAFAVGVMTVQLVIVAKVIGRILSPRVRSVREVYISKGEPDVR